MPRLAELASGVSAVVHGDPQTPVSGIIHDSRDAAGGELFVALPGLHTSGTAHIRDAVRSGVAAVCVSHEDEHAARDAGVPFVLVEDTRCALADFAAAFYGNPASQLQLIGITGTLGKTSTAALIQAALSASPGASVGVVGSLGVSADRGVPSAEGAPQLSLNGMTTPDSLHLQQALRALADAGVRQVVMEVTSHALAQERVHGLGFALGVVTNLVPDEHLDFHGSPADYLHTKARFLDHLEPHASVVYNADDALVCDMVESRLEAKRRIAVCLQHERHHSASRAGARSPAVWISNVRWDATGSAFDLVIDRSLPTLSGGVADRGSTQVQLGLIGVQHITNAALAAATALVAGASRAEVQKAMLCVPPVSRRMEIVRAQNPCIIDDTTGNPETLRAVMDTVQAIPRSGLRVLFGLRGSRGVEINRGLAEALAELMLERAAIEPATLVVTCCEDVAGPRDRVQPEERDVALEVLRTALERGSAPVSFSVEPTLEAAARSISAGMAESELLLLLGTQGMDTAASVVLPLLRRGVNDH